MQSFAFIDLLLPCHPRISFFSRCAELLFYGLLTEICRLFEIDGKTIPALISITHIARPAF